MLIINIKPSYALSKRLCCSIGTSMQFCSGINDPNKGVQLSYFNDDSGEWVQIAYFTDTIYYVVSDTHWCVCLLT